MFTIENHAGRLFEMRFGSPFSAADFQRFREEHQAVAARMEGDLVAVADVRGATRVFPPEVIDGFVELMNISDPRIVRSAYLIGDSELFRLQAERARREGGDAERRIFRGPAALREWLHEILTEEEFERLLVFLPPE